MCVQAEHRHWQAGWAVTTLLLTKLPPQRIGGEGEAPSAQEWPGRDPVVVSQPPILPHPGCVPPRGVLEPGLVAATAWVPPSTLASLLHVSPRHRIEQPLIRSPEQVASDSTFPGGFMKGKW